MTPTMYLIVMTLYTNTLYTYTLHIQDQTRRFEEKHMFKTLPSADLVSARIDKWAEDLKKMELDVQNKDENKEVALGTSKINVSICIV